MTKRERFTFMAVLLVMFLFIASIKDALAEEWVFSGDLKDPAREEQKKGSKMTIRIIGNPGDKIFTVEITEKDFNREGNGDGA